MYPVKVKRVGHFVTTMTISGEGFSTGKSLMCDSSMLALYGEKLDCCAPNSVPKLFDMLGSGIPIYGKNSSLNQNSYVNCTTIVKGSNSQHIAFEIVLLIIADY